MSWSVEEIAAVRDQVARMSDSSAFKNAGRMAPLLSYLVDAELEGQGPQLNQTRIAIDVMGRDASFDASTDSIVRVEIGRLRSKLFEYYAVAGKDDAVFIELPKGRYKPIVAFREGCCPSSDCSTKANEAPKAEDNFMQDVRYCRTDDGVSIAYAESGSGPTLVKAGNWLSHLEFDVKSPVWRHWWVGLSQRHRLVRYDPRGCGLSDWDAKEMSFDKLVDDLERVADSAAPERFAVLGISQGSAVAIAYAARHPERVSHLILYGGFARGQLRRGDKEAEDTFALVQDIIRIGWGKPHGAFRQVLGSLFMPEGTSEQFRWFDELSRISMLSENALQSRECAARADVEHLLEQIKVPTIVLHAADEILVPFSEARFLAARIPGARLVSLESKNHLILEHEPAWRRFLSEVERFVAGA